MGKTRTFVKRSTKDIEVIDVGGGIGAVCSLPSPGSEPTSNEDAAVVMTVREDTAVLAVADGAGGHPGGAEAAAMAVRHLAAAVSSAAESERSVRDGVLDGFESANSAILDMNIGAAATLAAVEVEGRLLRCYHAGDAAVLVTGRRGKIKLLTKSHSPVGYAVEAGLLGRREALHHEDLSVVSNLLGSASMHIEVGTAVKLASRDTVVVGSDGLFDNLHANEIAERVRAGALEQCAQSLARFVLSRMTGAGQTVPSKPDDLTFVLFRHGARPRSR